MTARVSPEVPNYALYFRINLCIRIYLLFRTEFYVPVLFSLIGSSKPALVKEMGFVVFGDYYFAKLLPTFLLDKGSKLVSFLFLGLIFAIVSVLYFFIFRKFPTPSTKEGDMRPDLGIILSGASTPVPSDVCECSCPFYLLVCILCIKLYFISNALKQFDR